MESMEPESESRHLVELTDSRSGKSFRIYLTSYELNRCNRDKTFLDEITEKYSELRERGLMRTFNDDEAEELQLDETQVVESNSIDQRYHWPRPAVLLLLAELEKRKQEMQNPHKKRIFFTTISRILCEHGYPVTWEVCERKWRGMQSMYKKILNKENMSGTGHSHWDFFDTMQNLLASDPSYNTPATVTAGTSTYMSLQQEAIGGQAVNEKGKCKRKKMDNTQTAIVEVQETIRELKSEIQESNRIQLERNRIMDKVANVLEKLVNS